METILANLADPSWWFSSFFPAVVIILLQRLFRPLWARTKIFLRTRRAKELSKIKRLRWDDMQITYEMQKAAALLVIFILSIVLALVSLLLSPVTKSTLHVIIVSIPILWSELAWLSRDKLVKEVILYRKKLNRP